jgi:hypothetical protein
VSATVTAAQAVTVLLLVTRITGTVALARATGTVTGTLTAQWGLAVRSGFLASTVRVRHGQLEG